MNLFQAWLAIGVPALIVVGALFAGRSRTRALLGYVALLALVAFFLSVPGGAISAAALGALGVVFVATGRGTARDERYREHHEERRRYTTAADETA